MIQFLWYIQAYLDFSFLSEWVMADCLSRNWSKSVGTELVMPLTKHFQRYWLCLFSEQFFDRYIHKAEFVKYTIGTVSDQRDKKARRYDFHATILGQNESATPYCSCLSLLHFIHKHPAFCLWMRHISNIETKISWKKRGRSLLFIPNLTTYENENSVQWHTLETMEEATDTKQRFTKLILD